MQLKSGSVPDAQPPAPYSATPVFDEVSLPAGLRREHRTKPGVWGIVRVIEGELKLSYVDPPGERVLTPDASGLLLPDQAHFVTVKGPMRMQVEFYDRPPMPRPMPRHFADAGETVGPTEG